MKRSIVVICCCVIPILCTAQTGDEIFKVIACKGKITLQRTKKALTIGSSLTAADQLKCEGKVYLGLIHKSGKAVEWMQEGVVPVSDLMKKVPPGQNGMEKLVAFVVNSVVGAGEKKELSGSVERSFTPGITLVMPRTTKIITPNVRFVWSGGDGPKPHTYIFTLTDSRQNVRYKREVLDTALVLNFEQLGLNPGQCYYWTVSQENPSSQFTFAPLYQSYCVYPMKPDESAAFMAQLTELNQNLSNPQTAMDKLLLAMLYEQQGLTYQALQYYKDLLTSAGDVDVFVSAYRQFLERLGVDAPTEKLIK